VLRGVGIWTPQYSSVAALCTAAFNSSAAATSKAGLHRASADAADLWPQIVDAIVQGVCGWHVDLAGCPLIFATTKGDIRRTIRVVGQPDAPLPKLADDAIAIADACGFCGEVICISTACASSLAALCEAHLLLTSQPSLDRVAIVTADTASAFVQDGFASLRAVAEAGARPFDASHGGLCPGSAAAWCLLERGAALPNDIQLLGWGLANDAAHLTAPDAQGRGLTAAIHSAVQAGNMALDDIDVIMAHGTGTAFSDAMEARVFAQLFAHQPPLTAAKGLLGHTLGASGLLELSIACEMLRRQQIPPIAGLIRCDYPGINPVCGQPTQPTRPIRTVLKTASGFGGVNAAVIIGRYDR